MKILFFSPHAAVEVHAIPEALLAAGLKKAGHQVIQIGCDGLFKRFCISMSAAGLNEDSAESEKTTVCAKCKTNREAIFDACRFDRDLLESYIVEEDRQHAKQVASSTPLIRALELTESGAPIGKIAAYEFLLNHKRSSFDLTEVEESRYRIHLENSVLSLRASRRLLEHWKPDLAFLYNGLYSVNHAFRFAAESRGVKTYFLHAGENIADRLSWLMVAPQHTIRYREELVRQWAERQHLPVTDAQMDYVNQHFRQLAAGQHFLVYSKGVPNQPVDIRASFGIRRDQKVLLATLSSYDERYAAELEGAMRPSKTSVFADQLSWILETIRLAQLHPDWFVIVRVHPRELPNRRESVQSDHARQLRAALTDLPDNVRVNWPQDNLSLYSLALGADVVLNAWSSTGTELALLGLPVVAYSSDLMIYAPDLNLIATSVEDYERKILTALEQKHDPERVRRMYRWYWLMFRLAVAQVDYPPEGRRRLRHVFINRIVDRTLRRVGLLPPRLAAMSADELESYRHLSRELRRAKLHPITVREMDELVRKKFDTLAELRPADANPSFEDEIRALRTRHPELVSFFQTNSPGGCDNDISNSTLD
jgi:hypothetical protein